MPKASQVHAGSKQLLNAVDLVAHDGEIVALIGPNGAGKTTLLKALLGLIHTKELPRLPAKY